MSSHFTPVDATWMIVVGDAKYALVGWLDTGGFLPVPVVATDNGINDLFSMIAFGTPWKIRYAAEEDW